MTNRLRTCKFRDELASNRRLRGAVMDARPDPRNTDRLTRATAATANYFVGSVTADSSYASLVVAIATGTEGYALLATFPAANSDAIVNDFTSILDSITVA